MSHKFPHAGRWTLAAVIASASLVGGVSALAQGLTANKSFEAAERMSNDQKVQQATGDITRMKRVLEMALSRVTEANEERDFVRLNCINEKLGAIKGLLKIGEQAEISLQEAVARGDQELTDHEFTKISIAAVRAENFRVEIEGCVGELSKYTGDTVVERTVDNNIRTDQPNNQDALALPPIDLDRPVVVSPSQ